MTYGSGDWLAFRAMVKKEPMATRRRSLGADESFTMTVPDRRQPVARRKSQSVRRAAKTAGAPEPGRELTVVTGFRRAAELCIAADESLAYARHSQLNAKSLDRFSWMLRAGSGRRVIEERA